MSDVQKSCALCGGVIRVDRETDKTAHLRDGTWWRDTAGINVCLGRQLDAAKAEIERLTEVRGELKGALMWYDKVFEKANTHYQTKPMIPVDNSWAERQNKLRAAVKVATANIFTAARELVKEKP